MRQISRLQYERTPQEWPIRIPSVNADTTLPVLADVESARIVFADSAPLCAQPVQAVRVPMDASAHQQQAVGPEVFYSTPSRNLGATAADLGGEEESTHGRRECFVCLDQEADAVLIECGHGGLCAGALL